MAGDLHVLACEKAAGTAPRHVVTSPPSIGQGTVALLRITVTLELPLELREEVCVGGQVSVICNVVVVIVVVAFAAAAATLRSASRARSASPLHPHTIVALFIVAVCPRDADLLFRLDLRSEYACSGLRGIVSRQEQLPRCLRGLVLLEASCTGGRKDVMYRQSYHTAEAASLDTIPSGTYLTRDSMPSTSSLPIILGAFPPAVTLWAT